MNTVSHGSSQKTMVPTRYQLGASTNLHGLLCCTTETTQNRMNQHGCNTDLHGTNTEPTLNLHGSTQSQHGPTWNQHRSTWNQHGSVWKQAGSIWRQHWSKRSLHGSNLECIIRHHINTISHWEPDEHGFTRIIMEDQFSQPGVMRQEKLWLSPKIRMMMCQYGVHTELT